MRMVARAWKVSICVVAIAATAAAAPGVAQAGEYTVSACQASLFGLNHSWTQSASRGMGTATACPYDSEGHLAGVAAFAAPNAGPVAVFASAYSRFDAPPGTSIAAATLDYEFWRSDPDWFTGLQADDTRTLDGCGPNDGHTACNASNPVGHARVRTFRPNSRSLRVVVACGDVAGCGTTSTGRWPYSRAYATIHAAQVVLEDPSPPAVKWTGGGLASDAWLRGPQAGAFTATDNSGVSRTQLSVDGRVEEDSQRHCDYSYTVPCSNVQTGSYTLDTRTLSDGRRSVALEAYDAGGNVSRRTSTIHVDNTPPNQVENPLVLEGESSWYATNSFSIAWTNPPDDASPITDAYYEIRDTTGTVVSSGRQSSVGISAVTQLSVPTRGDYTARVWVGDAAGNVNPANKSPVVHLKFDDAAPGQAAVTAPGRWIGLRDAARVPVTLSMAPSAFRPTSGVAGYSVTTDGREPDASIDAPGTAPSYELRDLPESTTTIRARAVSGAGVASRTTGSATVLVDRSSPQVRASSSSDPDVWQREPISLTIEGADQDALSGMTPAPAGVSPEAGGHITYSVDDGPTANVRGPVATAAVALDGKHVVAYQAFDAAGNASAQRSLALRLDQTPPDRVVFDQPNPADRRTVTVSASDRTSGIASGTIEIRPASIFPEWRRLPTTRVGDKLQAKLDDVSGIRGFYELRAIVTDEAGNSAVGDTYADGSPVVIDTRALRTGTSIKLIGAPTRSIAFGEETQWRGAVTTAGTKPVPDAPVAVFEKLAAPGAAYRRLGATRTDAYGSFEYHVAAGASRAIRFAYGGDARRRPSDHFVSLRVPAQTTIKATPRRLHVGETVTLTGRVRTLGAPIPQIGKLVDLEAYDLGRWRKFATVRTKPNGSWRYTYRFIATRGTATYPMRAVVIQEAAFPFETGMSKAVRVTVHGT